MITASLGSNSISLGSEDFIFISSVFSINFLSFEFSAPRIVFIMSSSSPERQALCNSLTGPFHDINSDNIIVGISIFTVIITPRVVRLIVLGVCFPRQRQKPKPPVLCQYPQQYELGAIEEGNDLLPSHSVSQSSSSAQLPGEVTTAAVTAALSTPSQIEDVSNTAWTDDAKPLPSTRTRKNYIILTVSTILVIVEFMARCAISVGFCRCLCCTLSERSIGITVNSHKIVVPAIGLRFCRALPYALGYPLGQDWANSDIVHCWSLLMKNLWYGQAKPQPQQNSDERWRPFNWLTSFFGALIGVYMPLIVLIPLFVFIMLILCVLFIVVLQFCWLRLRGRQQRSELPVGPFP
jgi:hypothetical protein